MAKTEKSAVDVLRDEVVAGSRKNGEEIKNLLTMLGNMRVEIDKMKVEIAALKVQLKNASSSLYDTKVERY